MPTATDTLTLSAAPATINPGETSLISIEGVKANGRPMPDDTLVVFQADFGSFIDAEGKAVEAALLVNGKGSITYKSDPTYTGVAASITAKSGTAVVKPEALVIALRNLDITKLTIDADPLTIPPGSSSSTITVTGFDPQMTPVAGKIISLAASAGAITPASGYENGMTDANGELKAVLTTTKAATVTATYKEVTAQVAVAVGVNTPPVAAFEFSPQNPESDVIIYFTDNSTDADGEVVARRWNFGDGTSSTSKNPTHIYRSILVATEFKVGLTVTDNDGAETTVFQSVTVNPSTNLPPVAAFVWSPTAPRIGETVYFISQSTDEDGDIVSYLWQFGDGTQSTLKNPSHYYNVTEKTVFKVQLTVTDDGGKSNAITQEVTIGAEIKAPVAAFTVSPTDPVNGQTVYFDASASSGGDGTITAYTWSFGDGDSGSGRNVQHAFTVTKDTTFTVTLTITTSNGLTATTAGTVKVTLN